MKPCKCGCGQLVTPNRIGRPALFVSKAHADAWHNTLKKRPSRAVVEVVGMSREQRRARLALELLGLTA